MVANEDLMLFTQIWFQESSQTIEPDRQKTTQTDPKLSRVHFPEKKDLLTRSTRKEARSPSELGTQCALTLSDSPVNLYIPLIKVFHLATVIVIAWSQMIEFELLKQFIKLSAYSLQLLQGRGTTPQHLINSLGCPSVP